MNEPPTTVAFLISLAAATLFVWLALPPIHQAGAEPAPVGQAVGTCATEASTHLAWGPLPG